MTIRTRAVRRGVSRRRLITGHNIRTGNDLEWAAIRAPVSRALFSISLSFRLII